MSSILTNIGAMVALQSLKSINSGLLKTQNEISTGKSVSNAKDNSAIWAISKVMESDVQGFKAIASSLSLGESTVAVARQAAETVTDLLTKMKDKIVASQEANVDRDKIQADITALRDQIGSVVGAAQFNGLNLLSNNKTTSTYTAAGRVDDTGVVNVLSSIDRSGKSVKSSDIAVNKQDLSTKVGTKGALVLAATAMTAAGTATANGAASATYTINGETTTLGRTKAVMAGDSYAFQMTIFDNAGNGTPFALAAATKQEALYVAKDGDTTADVAKGMAEMMQFRLAEQGLENSYSVSVDGNKVSVTNNTATAMVAAAVGNLDMDAGGATSGGLHALSEFDVTTGKGASAALVGIESLIQTAVDSAASFGSVAGRIETQAKFVSGLTDALKAGIGTLVDANMEEASAKLQALQVQQQLGVQSLSIANQAPQSILSLFR
ncbi:flagellin [Oceaniovalibus sp. ACAM 378]|uniref:flagellin N-terminal helical domain-containing protein n=1 Tax=Oceaniovalibus sp. ACAM 378 TaxID=2599923 RepID=UPI0011DB7079|nr:flagellin [Oceaniovalibus sp. ACAM 378]TYB87861.1 flagellin [Oceaniovalibus sp. ACAM 378]